MSEFNTFELRAKRANGNPIQKANQTDAHRRKALTGADVSAGPVNIIGAVAGRNVARTVAAAREVCGLQVRRVLDVAEAYVIGLRIVTLEAETKALPLVAGSLACFERGIVQRWCGVVTRCEEAKPPRVVARGGIP